MSTGEVVQVQAEQQFRTASVSKMIVLMALMDRVSLGRADLKDLVVYSPNDFEWRSGVIAFNRLWRYLGTEGVYTFFEEVIGHETNRGTFFMSAEDAAKLMKIYEARVGS